MHTHTHTRVGCLAMLVCDDITFQFWLLYAAELFSHHTFIACECVTDRCDSGSINNKYVHNVIARRRFYTKTKLTTDITCKSISCGNCFLRSQPLFYHVNHSLNQAAEFNSIDSHFVVCTLHFYYHQIWEIFSFISENIRYIFELLFQFIVSCNFLFLGEKKWVEI